ncbi:hypothetical protein LTA6_001726 [Microbacterium sp. LTA6]|uniref:hypothetical protein n=1 Tax=Microbacterium sp. LTA6 TaxID=3129771 RepID=UPI0032552B57
MEMTKKCTMMVGAAAVLVMLVGGNSPALAASNETSAAGDKSPTISRVVAGIPVDIGVLEAARSEILRSAAGIKGTARPTDHTVRLINNAASEMQQVGNYLGGTSASALLRAEQDMRNAFAHGDATEGYNIMIRVANALQAAINSYARGDREGVRWS